MGTAVTSMLDLRRTDLRTNVLENPYWITSEEITEACDDKAAVLFSFPIGLLTTSLSAWGNTVIVIQEMALEVNETFLGSGSVAVVECGMGMLATDDEDTTVIITGGVADPNQFWEVLEGDAAVLNLGMNFPIANGAYNDDRLLGQHAISYVITPSDTASNVPCVTFHLSNDAATLTQGSAFLHMLLAVVPNVS